MKGLTYSIMHGAGNYFAVFDLREPHKYSFENVDILSNMHDNIYSTAREKLEKIINREVKGFQKKSREICNGTGKKMDGILLLFPSFENDAKMVVINYDGSRPEMCGNGIRCVSHLMLNKDSKSREKYDIETDAGKKRVSIKRKTGEMESYTSVEMGTPVYKGEKIVPIESSRFENKRTKFEKARTKKEGWYKIEVHPSDVDIGNPHKVIIADKDCPDEYFYEFMEKYGAVIENHKKTSPKKTNVHIVRKISREKNKRTFEIRTWERGVGLTAACGTGACASGFALVCNNEADPDEEINMKFEYNTLKVKYDSKINQMIMTGPSVLENIKSMNVNF